MVEWPGGREISCSEPCYLKEELREARVLGFLGILEKISAKPQPEGVKIGLRKDFLSGKTEREVEILPPSPARGKQDFSD